MVPRRMANQPCWDVITESVEIKARGAWSAPHCDEFDGCFQCVIAREKEQKYVWPSLEKFEI